ncbi:MAG: hypothetical protein JSS66_00175 [Armatimonadetes bacterium]|nr:hypothetical protein [Armatimonadota bacterium]
MTQYVELSPFLGVVSSLSNVAIDPKYAGDIRNLRIEDGELNVRCGYRSLTSAVSGSTAVKHFNYYAGYTASGLIPVSEYISIEQRFGTVRPFSVSASGCARTEITASGSSLSLYNSYWRGLTWQDRAFLWNYNDTTYPLAQYTLGQVDSWRAIKVPIAPTNGRTDRISVVYAKDASGLLRYRELTWAGLDVSTEVTYTGNATSANSGVTTDTLSIAHVTSASGLASFTVDLNGLTAGIQDWTYNDCLFFTLNPRSSSFKINAQSIKVTLTNNDGSPITVDLATNAGETTHGDLGVYSFFTDKTRGDWDNTRYLKVEYQVTASSASAVDNRLDMGKVQIGGITNWKYPVTLGYSYYDELGGYESGIGGAGTLDQTLLQGSLISLQGVGSRYLGTIPRVTVQVSPWNSPTPTATRLYVQDQTKWRRVASHPVSSLTYLFSETSQSIQTLDEYQITPYQHDNIVCAAVIKGAWIVWGYRGGASNIRHSRIGDPLRQASDLDLESDESRGATFTLSDTLQDEPVAFYQVGNAIIVLGQQACYAQVGDRPSNLTRPQRIAGSYGCIGFEASCKWRDDQGREGVAYVSADGQSVYFVTVDDSFNGNTGFLYYEVTRNVRGLMKSFLTNSVLTNPEVVMMGVDHRSDALWIVYASRAMVYRRPSLVDGQRQWELYEYNIGSSDFDIASTFHWVKLNFSQDWGIRAIRINGVIDELEYDSSQHFEPITGTNRDGGSAVFSDKIYWQSKRFDFDRAMRLFGVRVIRDDSTDQPTFIVDSDRQTDSCSYAVGKNQLRFSPMTRGYTFQIKIKVPESAEALTKAVLEFHGPEGKRRAS